MASTRREILARLRRGPRTVEELAADLGLTDNAIRSHLATLERDGMIRQQGLRRGPGAGKPAVIYDLHPDSEVTFSKAYAPVLATLMEVMGESLTTEKRESVLRETGRRIAGQIGRPQGAPLHRRPVALEQRVDAAVEVLESLGGDITVTRQGRGYRLQSSGCPLGAAVAKQPGCCVAVEELLATLTDAPVRECCDRGERPRCAFLVGATS